MHAARRCPRCGGFLFSGTNDCAVCPSDDGATDDFDLLVGEPGKGEITLELEKIAERSGVTLPVLEESQPSSVTKHAIVPPATMLPSSVPPPAGSRPADDTKDDEAAERAAFGEPGGGIARHALYFVRVWNRRARLAEQAALLHRGARGIGRELDLRYARLGQALLASHAERARYPALAAQIEVTERGAEMEEREPLRARSAYVELGRASYELGAGQTLEGRFWDVQKTRATHETMLAQASRHERMRVRYDVEAYERGRLLLVLLSLSLVLLSLGLCFT